MCAHCKDNCCKKQHGMHRFIEVCMLMLLLDDTRHGYSLAEQLCEFGFEAEDLNISTLYRTLRKMEEQGSVKSMWEEGQGPKRRVYTITETGKNELADWVGILEKRKQRIEKLIETYNQKTGHNDY